MPRHRSLNLKKFIDSIPEPLIKEYFRWKLKRRKAALPFKTLDHNSVNNFLDTIPDEELKSSILEDFTHINDICEKMMNYLVRATQYYDIPTTGEEERQELAMHVFLHHKEAYEYAYDYYCLYNASSKMSHHKIPARNFKVTAQRINRFKESIKAFYVKSAKGQECRVRHYDEEDQAVILVIHGSYKRSVSIWEGQEIKTLFFRPANEDILQFSRKTSVLSIKAPYKKDKDNYIRAFTETILRDETRTSDLFRDEAYSLKPLQDGTFSFAGNDVITSVRLLEAKLAIRGLTNPEVVIRSSNVLETLENDLQGISIDSGELVHAKFRFTLKINGKPRRITFEITPPNVTDLTRKKYADIIGAYLKENGVKLV